MDESSVVINIIIKNKLVSSYTSFNLLFEAAWSGCTDSKRFWHEPGAQGNINLQDFPYFAFTCLKLFRNVVAEIQVIKYT